MTRLPVYSLQPALNGLDLAELEDEQLVGVAQAYEDPSAWGELMARCGELRERLLDRCISRCGLQDADRLDTQQEGVLWMVEAIKRYQLEQAPGAPGCRFRTFLYRVLRARFIDSLRHRRHLQRHVQFVGTLGVWRKAVGEADRWGSAGTNGVNGRRTNPEQAAEQSEQRASLQQELDRLGGPARRLWELLGVGMRLREIAAALGLSYDAVKRRRRELLAHLRARLNREGRA